MYHVQVRVQCEFMFMFKRRWQAANGQVLCASRGDGPPRRTYSTTAHRRAERADARQEVKTDTVMETEADEVRDERS